MVIKNLDRLLGSQHNNHKDKAYFCRACFHGFSSSELLQKHTENGCVMMVGSQIVLPEKGEVMEFENNNNKLRPPLVIHADSEATNLPTNDDKRRTHKANSYGFMTFQIRCDTV